MNAQTAPAGRPPMAVGAAILLVFLLIALACILLPAAYLLDMFDSIFSRSPQVVIEKGAYYLFGGGVALLALLPDGFYNTILRRKPPANAEKLTGRLAIVGLLMMPALPALIHYPTAHHLQSRGYAKCEALSSQWLFVRTIVFTLPGEC